MGQKRFKNFERRLDERTSNPDIPCFENEVQNKAAKFKEYDMRVNLLDFA